MVGSGKCRVEKTSPRILRSPISDDSTTECSVALVTVSYVHTTVECDVSVRVPREQPTRIPGRIYRMKNEGAAQVIVLGSARGSASQSIILFFVKKAHAS